MGFTPNDANKNEVTVPGAAIGSWIGDKTREFSEFAAAKAEYLAAKTKWEAQEAAAKLAAGQQGGIGAQLLAAWNSLVSPPAPPLGIPARPAAPTAYTGPEVGGADGKLKHSAAIGIPTTGMMV